MNKHPKKTETPYERYERILDEELNEEKTGLTLCISGGNINYDLLEIGGYAYGEGRHGLGIAWEHIAGIVSHPKSAEKGCPKTRDFKFDVMEIIVDRNYTALVRAIGKRLEQRLKEQVIVRVKRSSSTYKTQKVTKFLTRQERI